MCDFCFVLVVIVVVFVWKNQICHLRRWWIRRHRTSRRRQRRRGGQSETDTLLGNQRTRDFHFLLFCLITVIYLAIINGIVIGHSLSPLSSVFEFSTDITFPNSNSRLSCDGRRAPRLTRRFKSKSSRAFHSLTPYPAASATIVESMQLVPLVHGQQQPRDGEQRVGHSGQSELQF